MKAAERGLNAGIIGPQLLMFEHPPTITMGLSAKESSLLVRPDELESRSIEFRKTDRGGDATWHGPGQLVGYPIVNLIECRLSVPSFVKAIEEGLIGWLQSNGLESMRIEGKPGVWVTPGKKIASIGVKVSGGITTHGFALNLTGSLEGSDAILPCGFSHVKLTTLEIEKATSISTRASAAGVSSELSAALGMEYEFQDLS